MGICGGGGARLRRRLVGIDLATWLVVKSISCKAPLHWFVVTPDGRKAYTANKQHAFISILDLEQERMTGTILVPEGCEEPDISPDGRLAYFPTPGLRFGHTPERTQVRVVDTKSDKIVQTTDFS